MLVVSQHGIVLKWCLKVLNICQSNVGGPGDYHTKQRQSEREGQVSYGIAYMWNLRYDTNKSIYDRDRLS